MFASFRRHQWLWVIIFGVVIISFIISFGSQQNPLDFMRRSAESTVGTIHGRPVTREEYLGMYREAQLRYYFSYGQWPEDNEMMRQLGIMERETKNRLVLVEKMREFNIEVSESAVAQWIGEAFRDPKQAGFRKDAYDNFVKQMLPSIGLKEKDFTRFVRHEVGMQHLISVGGIAGKLVTPQEAEAAFRRENEQVETEAVFLSTSNYLAAVTMDETALRNYYTNQASQYRIPERVVVNFVRFDATNYLAEAAQAMSQRTNLNQLIEAQYEQRGASFYVDAAGQPLPADAAKEKIREEVRKNFALLEARKKSIDFVNKLITLEKTTNTLANLAAAEGLQLHISPPFGQNEQPVGMNVPDTFVRTAFALSPDQPVSEETLVGEDAVYVIGFHSRIKSDVPPFEDVRERVVEEYRRSKAFELAQSAGRELQAALTNAVAQAKTFQAAAAEAGHTSVSLPLFSQQTSTLAEVPNRSDFTAIKNAAFALSPGQVSAYTPTGSGGFILYLKGRVPVSDARLQVELPPYLKEMRKNRQMEAFSEWLRKETELARVSLPGDQPAAN